MKNNISDKKFKFNFAISFDLLSGRRHQGSTTVNFFGHSAAGGGVGGDNSALLPSETMEGFAPGVHHRRQHHPADPMTHWTPGIHPLPGTQTHNMDGTLFILS